MLVAACELRRVGLAEKDHARVPQTPGVGCVLRRNEIGEKPRVARGPDPFSERDVLVGHWDTVEWTSPAARDDVPLSLPCLCPGSGPHTR